MSVTPNGFLALAEFDKPENGGNGDGVIDSRDIVYLKLRLWIDVTHDGISQANELQNLADLGVYSISLRYRSSKWTDQFGNSFRYVAQVNQGGKSTPDRWAFDVFLVTDQQTRTATRTHMSHTLLAHDEPLPWSERIVNVCSRRIMR